MFRFRSRRTIAVSLTVAAAACGAVGALALPSASSAGKAHSHPELRWTAVHQSGTQQPRTTRPGDSWATYLKVYDDDTHEVVGDGSTRCVAVSTDRRGTIAQCQEVLRTREGDLALSSMVDRFGPGHSHGKAAVTGGTGRYAEVSGDVEVVMEKRREILTLHLRD